jgi:hypothetical protein
MKKLRNKFASIIEGQKTGAVKILILIFLLVQFSTSDAQNVRDQAPPLSERIFFGGSFGLQFGTLTNIQVAPVVGLWVLPRLAVAAGPDFTYYKFYDDKTSMYGGKAYTQFVILQDLNNILPLGVHMGMFLHLEDEFLNLESAYWKNPPYASERFNINTVLVGGGISQQLGRRSFMNVTLLWALTDPGYQVYGEPEIRLSFNF